jgi:hypothetical protein
VPDDSIRQDEILNLGGSDVIQIKAAMLFIGEFDSGSERTLAAWIRHASRTGQVAISV